MGVGQTALQKVVLRYLVILRTTTTTEIWTRKPS